MAKATKSFHRKWRWHRVTLIAARDGMRCHICGGELSRKVQDPEDHRYITFDHALPRSKGGLDVVSNLKLAHRRCNNLRGSDPLMPEDEAPDPQK